MFLSLFIVLQLVSAEFDSLSDEELACLNQRKALYGNECYSLGSAGPCRTGIFVFDEKQANSVDIKVRLTPVCRPQRCVFLEYYWPETGECISVRSAHLLCNRTKGLELISNEYDFGECVCKLSPVHVRNSTNNYCYPLFKQGLCPHGMVVGVINNTSEALCVKDTCSEQNNNNDDEDVIYAPWEDGICYKLETRGPCKKKEIFQIDILHMTVTCKVDLNIFFANKSKLQDTCNGKCKTYNFKSSKGASDFIRHTKEQGVRGKFRNRISPNHI